MTKITVLGAGGRIARHAIAALLDVALHARPQPVNARLLAERTGAPSWRAGWAELLVTSGDADLARTGSAVFRELVDDGHAGALTGRQCLLHAHTLLARQTEAGEGAAVLAAQLPRLTALGDDERLDLETDLAHPSITGDRDAWLKLLTRRWRDAGMLVPRLLTDAELAQLQALTSKLRGADAPGGATTP